MASGLSLHFRWRERIRNMADPLPERSEEVQP
jgi:hypothetical protein